MPTIASRQFMFVVLALIAGLGSTNAMAAISAVASGYDNHCILTSAGAAKCWGDNTYGQIGDGTTQIDGQPHVAYTSVQVTGLTSSVTAVSVGYHHACAVIAGGAVKCWGDNSSGQLGNGSTVSSNSPVQVTGLTSGVTAVSSGFNYTCALTSAGAVKCWGKNEGGQLGNNTLTNSNVPVQVSGLNSGVVAITTSRFESNSGSYRYVTCAVMNTGSVMCWSESLGATNSNSLVPVAVNGISDAVSITAGRRHACALTSAGAVKCWGYEQHGEFGDGNYNTSLPAGTTAQPVGLTSGVIAISAGLNHTCALTNLGAVKCWGQNNNGEIGNGTASSPYGPNQDALVPTQVTGITSGAIGISAGDFASCAVTDSSNVKCWGSVNTSSVGNAALVPLGDDTGLSSTTPVLVVGLGQPFVPSSALSISLTASMALTGNLSSFTYTALISNGGPNIATNNVVTFQLPAGMTYVPGPLSCNVSGSIITCPINDIISGGSISTSITGTVASYGDYSVTASVTSAVADPNPSNNAISMTSTYAPPPPPFEGDIPTLPQWGAILMGSLLLANMIWLERRKTRR